MEKPEGQVGTPPNRNAKSALSRKLCNVMGKPGPKWPLLVIPMIAIYLLLGESRRKEWGEGISALGRIVKDVKPQLSVLDELREKHLFPYDPTRPTNYTQPVHVNKEWKEIMPNIIAERLNYKMNGFFIECGALDGLFISNSLLLERKYGWTGLLVEADPKYFSILKARNRHAWVADVCLSPQPYPTQLEMLGHPIHPGLSFAKNDVVNRPAAQYSRKFQVDCFPLGMLLAALNRTEIDYMSLDVEGMELEILKTIPFDRIRIKLISLEVRPKTQKMLQDFLEPLGYQKFKHIEETTDFMTDDIYEFKGL